MGTRDGETAGWRLGAALGFWCRLKGWRIFNAHRPEAFRHLHQGFPSLFANQTYGLFSRNPPGEALRFPFWLPRLPQQSCPWFCPPTPFLSRVVEQKVGSPRLKRVGLRSPGTPAIKVRGLPSPSSGFVRLGVLPFLDSSLALAYAGTDMLLPFCGRQQIERRAVSPAGLEAKMATFRPLTCTFTVVTFGKTSIYIWCMYTYIYIYIYIYAYITYIDIHRVYINIHTTLFSFCLCRPVLLKSYDSQNKVLKGAPISCTHARPE